MLPDDVLLIIFDFYVGKYEQGIEQWKTLAHVCRRWRTVVFQSPHRLNLRLLCTPNTPVRDILDVWPPLPLIIHTFYPCGTSGVDNVIAALEHNDRVCEIKLQHLTSSQLEYVTNSAAMQKSFPELTDLDMFILDGMGPILPDSFLGRTAPRLRSLVFLDISFPGLPKLLLSATHLVILDLLGIPFSEYTQPETMAIFALTRLEYLRLYFEYPLPLSALERKRPSPPQMTRSILPSLTKIVFQGIREYLEEILARIDAPRLIDLNITFFDDIIFDTPQLFQFISRRPTLRAPEKGRIAFNSSTIIVKFPPQTSEYGVLGVEMGGIDEVQTRSRDESRHPDAVHGISGLGDLYTFEDFEDVGLLQDNIEHTSLWPKLLRLFVAVKSLYVTEEFVPRIALALQELVGGRTAEVLPALENIFLERFQPLGPLHEGIERFVAARRLTNHPVAVSRWDRDPEEQKTFWEFYDM